MLIFTRRIMTNDYWPDGWTLWDEAKRNARLYYRRARGMVRISCEIFGLEFWEFAVAVELFMVLYFLPELVWLIQFLLE